MIEEANAETNHLKEAENLCEMIKDIGVTVGPSRRNPLKQITKMEVRNTKEAERLGSSRRTP